MGKVTIHMLKATTGAEELLRADGHVTEGKTVTSEEAEGQGKHEDKRVHEREEAHTGRP